MLRLNHIMKSSVVNGPGKRYTIWVQGCSIHCKGCINPDTWNPKAGTEIDEKTLIDDIKSLKGSIDGITLTGGEPLDQIDGLLKFLPEIFNEFSVFLISGYGKQIILEKKKEILKYVDILCSEPFVESCIEKNLLWKGSSNQLVEALTLRGEEQIKMPPKYRTEIVIDKDSTLITGFSIPEYLKKKTS
jgi:anaerobic ribonucleoside-triphosphate reductase activating protein